MARGAYRAAPADSSLIALQGRYTRNAESARTVRIGGAPPAWKAKRRGRGASRTPHATKRGKPARRQRGAGDTHDQSCHRWRRR